MDFRIIPIDRNLTLSYLEIIVELSKSQRQAVEYIAGPQIILAGAGSGKTRVIVAKTRYLIEQKGYRPDSLLIITYSRKTQEELEERMSALGKSAPEIKTFHALGLDIISEFGARLGIAGDIEMAGGFRIKRVLKNAIAELRESILLSGNRSEQVYGDLDRFISRAKDELAGPDEIIAKAEEALKSIPVGSDDDDEIIRKDRWIKTLEAGRIYKSYERIKAENGNLIDYGDMIFLAHRLLSADKLAGASIRQRVKYILVDEFQDSNFAQVELLHHLAGSHTGITVVGDDDQAIYRFRGASFGSFKLFLKLFPGTKAFSLEENYRSSGNIVRVAQSVIETDPKARFDSNKKMTPVSDPGEKVIARFCPDDVTEAESAAAEIERLLSFDQYGKPRSIAVLFRGRRHKNILENILRRRGIKFHYDRKTEETSSRPARLLMAFYGLTVDSGRKELLILIIRHLLPQLDPGLEREIGYRLSRVSDDPFEILLSMKSDLDDKTAESLSAMIGLLIDFRAMKEGKDPVCLLERIISRAGILSSVIVDGRINDRQALAEIAGILKAADSFGQESDSGSHSDFLEYLDWQKGAGDNGNDSSAEHIETPVILQTVHASKGLEYPAVFVIGLTNRKFPSPDRGPAVDFPPELYKDELPPGDFHIQEERRLFYVAMTRAKERLYLYGVKKKGVKISKFVDELLGTEIFEQAGLKEEIAESGVSIEKLIGPEMAIDLPKAIILPITDQPNRTPVISDGLHSLWKAISSRIESAEDFEKEKTEFRRNIESAVSTLYKKIDEDIYNPHPVSSGYQVTSLSYSDLGAFDTCPLQFYYRKALNMPSPSRPIMTFGSILHSVLETAARLLMTGGDITLDNLKSDFQSRWGRVRLDDPDQKDRMGQTATELLEYFMDAQSKLGGQPMELEQKFALELGGIKLTGRIDRVDKSPVGLEIIDYKTGRMDKKALKDDLQLPIYSLACKELYGEYPIRLMYMFLKSKEVFEKSFDPEGMDEIENIIVDKIEKIKSSDFTATPGFQCGNCGYNQICPASSP